MNTENTAKPTPCDCEKTVIRRQHGKKHTLIVEDNPLNSEILATLLGEYGLKTSGFEDPDQLEAYLRASDPPDLIFLDLEFDDHDGINAFEKLKDDGLIDEIPVIAYTVHLSEQERAREAGMNDFLGKPILSEYFNEQLCCILNDLPVWAG